MRRIGLWALSALFGLVVTVAQAAPPARTPLSAQDKADIARAEEYLNGVTTLKARFLQVSPNGASVEGDAYLSRPGRLRLQYDPPSPLLVVADGTFLIVHDSQLGEPSYIPLGSTPAGILVRPGLKLDGGDVNVTRVVRLPGVVRISMVEADDPAAGEITLVFSDKPFALRQWQVKDAQHQVTTVSLYQAQAGLSLDSKLFEFKNPKFTAPTLNTGN
ncbi:Outer membrane lipoprotein-sorting protein [Paramagnetospirillum caucaseum]|uniref:Outer membrane lipoprotein-sorting protein n=1 Tax=Paramagnetospirillum caucaseum TaxID=1244869 RepID=M3A6H4_9PROT|nr:outer membrane lipoprotein carrier protein LolA [Paramagnetospirillum caucaseum]EME68074.1 Outer membrane lipoprotein-sorting protein [Paramagnetospirillum caucaseum]